MPVIATMLLLTIVAGTVLVVYAYVSGATVLPDTDQHVGKMLEKLKTVEVKGYADGHFDVYITNTGSVDSVIDMFYVKDFLGGTLTAKEVTAPIAVGDTEEFLFDPYLVGQSPWSWYEIVGVTNRGNKFTVNLYGFYSGAYELGEGPHEYTAPNGSKIVEVDYPYNVYNVTIDGAPTNPSNLPNLTAIDGVYFSFPATDLNSVIASYPAGLYEWDYVANKWIDHGALENIKYLNNTGSPASQLIHINAQDFNISTVFTGSTTNMKYPKLVVTIIFDVLKWDKLSGTIQFYDWSTGRYVTSGNGYFAFNGSSLPAANASANVGSRNMTLIINTTNLLGQNGEWQILWNMTSTQKNENIKLDYFAVTEKADYMHAFETVFWYNASSVTNENNVTQMAFSTTGIFPASAPDYWFAVYNFDTKNWYYLGQIPGSSSPQTSYFELSESCSRYIQNGTKIVASRIIPTVDLPSLQQIQIDQSRLIIRQWEVH